MAVRINVAAAEKVEEQGKPSPKKKRSGRDKESKKNKAGEKVVSEKFAGNEYNGVIKEDTLGNRILEGSKSTYVWPGKARYEGPLVASEVRGRGKFTWPDGSYYEGDLVRGLRHGVGLYVAADGVTKYEGHWLQGKRHGNGRLTYDVSGESYYDGEWMDGSKHGFGRQVWPSGNVYEGEWRHGRKAGHGKMLWRDGGMVEQYEGQWEDDRPEGQGSHTWHATPPPMGMEALGGAAASRNMPSQQMNNRYDGEWHAGERHGNGTFSFANGARYDGNWVANIKEGRGRYMFEDGRVYTGPFANDQMAEPGAPAGGPASLRVLNIGAEDNPVRQCIDISDLEPMALPLDVGKHNLEIGSGYDEAHEVLREVHNMLLRYFGELKLLYAAYRQPLRKPDQDPFVLTVLQLWLMARDLDLLSLGCPLSRFNRQVFCGPRHHRENSHDGRDDTRPLTPRSHKFHSIRAASHECTTKPADMAELGEAPSGVEEGTKLMIPGSAAVEGSEAEESFEDTDEEEEESEAQAQEEEEEEMAPQRTVFESPGIPQAADAGELEVCSKKSSLAKLRSAAHTIGTIATMRKPSVAKHPSDIKRLGNELMPLFSKFWRSEESRDLTDVHTPGRRMMFRHFLEGVVRLAIARFPHEMGLEHQCRRVFKEKVLPSLTAATTAAVAAAGIPGAFAGSLACFALHCDDVLQPVLQEARPKLWELFKANATGDGGYCRPGWAHQPAPHKVRALASHEEDVQGVELIDAKDIQHRGTWDRQNSFAPTELSGDQHGSKASLVITEPAPAGEPLPAFAASTRVWRRGWGATHRRAHLAARLDATVRVKDVLRMLDGMGLLAPIADGWSHRSVCSDKISATRPTSSHSSRLGQQPPEEGKVDGPWSSTAALMALSGEVFPIPDTPAAQTNPTTTPVGNMKELDGLVSGRTTALDVDHLGGTLDRYSVASTLPRASPGLSINFASNRASISGSVMGIDEEAQSPAPPLASSSQSGPTDPPAVPDMSPEEAREAVGKMDFRASFLEVLHIITDMLPPAARHKLKWSVEADVDVKDETVGLLDYLETELTFFEFQRLIAELVAYATRCTSNPSVMPRNRILAAFFEKVFFPAAREDVGGAPYSPPEPPTPPTPAPLASPMFTSSMANALEADVDGGEAGEGEEDEPPPPPPAPEFWRGFDCDLDSAGLGAGPAQRVERRRAAMSQRVWPSGYELEVSHW